MMRAHSFHQILWDCNLKANASDVIQGWEIVKMAAVSKISKKGTFKLACIPKREGQFVSPRMFVPVI
jgi:hypothetical protein